MKSSRKLIGIRISGDSFTNWNSSRRRLLWAMNVIWRTAEDQKGDTVATLQKVSYKRGTHQRWRGLQLGVSL
jgi:hypothetical protein